jgi:hypothetical protein
MNKLTLNLEELGVDSFELSTPERPGQLLEDSAWSDDSVCPTVNPSNRRVCV